MKKCFSVIIILGLLLTFKSNGIAQNLVLNPSFENINTGSLQCSWYTSQAQFNSAIQNWTCPTGGSSDIFYSGLATSCFSSPFSTNGSSPGIQAPRTGSVMVGGSLFGNGGCSPYREYFQGVLSAPLSVGSTYKIEFYLSLGEKCLTGSNNIGVKFNNAPINVPSMCVYNVTPDVNYTGAPITNTTGWTKLEFCYTPTTTGLQHFMIGNFFNNVATTTVSVAGPGTFSNAYYFLDDVSITLSTSSSAITPTLNVTSICSSATSTLSALPAGINYTWTAPAGGAILSGINASNAIVSGNGIYTLTVSDPFACSGSTINSSTIVVSNPTSGTISPSSSGTITCNTPTVSMVSPLIAGSTYTWTGPGIMSGVNTHTAIVNLPGTYTLVSQNGGCTSTGTVSVNQNTLAPSLIVSPASSTLACSSGTMQLNATSNPTNCSYIWTPPATGSVNNSSINNPISTGTGEFTVSIVNPSNACTNSTTLAISPGPLSPTLTVNSGSVCSGGSLNLIVNGNANTYSWTPTNGLSLTTGTNVIATPSTTTTYTVYGSNGACSVPATAVVTVSPLPNLIFIPANPVVCEGQSANLTVTGANSYTWSASPSLNAINGATVISTPSVATTYTVQGLLNGCLGSNTLAIVVGSTVVVSASSNQSTICPGGAATLTAIGASSYTWSPTLDLNTQFGSMVIATPNANQTYTVIGATGTCTNSAQVVVTVTNNPVMSVSNSTICSGSSAMLSATGAASYSWTPNLFLNTNNSASVTSTPPLTQTYTVIGTSPLGCTSSATTAVTVIALPNLNVSATSMSLCPGESSTLTVTGASTYSWAPNNFLDTDIGTQVVSNPNASINYAVTGTNGSAPYICVSTKTISLIVMPTVTVTVVDPAAICYGNKGLLVASGGTNYSWQPANTVVHNDGSVTTVKPEATTIYTVTANSPGYCKGTATVELVVNPLPIINAGSDTTINMDQPLTLYGTGNTPEVGFLSLQSYPLDCNLCPVIIVNPQENTCFILRGVNQFGCVSYDEVCVTVTKEWDVYVPNAFTPNNDGINEIFSPVGYGISDIKLFIFNRWGEMIFESNDVQKGWDGKQKGRMCEQGVYVYQIEVTSMNNKKLFKTGHVTLLPKYKN